MPESAKGGCLTFFIIIIYIAAWVGTGTLAWNWVEPESFWGAVKFIFAWGILGIIAQLVGGAIVAGVASMSE